jgi:hypothetical protein
VGKAYGNIPNGGTLHKNLRLLSNCSARIGSDLFTIVIKVGPVINIAGLSTEGRRY